MLLGNLYIQENKVVKEKTRCRVVVGNEGKEDGGENATGGEMQR